MSKPFLEVFPGLKLDNQVRELLDKVEVEKITSTSRKDFLRIYIASGHLIQKEMIYKLEKQIHDNQNL